METSELYKHYRTGNVAELLVACDEWQEKGGNAFDWWLAHHQVVTLIADYLQSTINGLLAIGIKFHEYWVMNLYNTQYPELLPLLRKGYRPPSNQLRNYRIVLEDGNIVHHLTWIYCEGILEEHWVVVHDKLHKIQPTNYTPDLYSHGEFWR